MRIVKLFKFFAACLLNFQGFKHYRKEFKRLEAENENLWEENERIKKAYENLKSDAMQLRNLMRIVTGEMSSALGFMEKESKDKNEDSE